MVGEQILKDESPSRFEMQQSTEQKYERHQMTQFTIHTLETAPAASKPALEKLKAAVGMIPNLAGAMSESPQLIEAFATLGGLLRAGSSFSPVEREIISLVNAVENGCRYCMAIHSTFALHSGVKLTTVDAIRAGQSPGEVRLNALTEYARTMLRERGQINDAALQSFFKAGFTRAQSLEIIAALALSIMANYAGHLTHVPPDEAIKAQYK
jgi:uncharacterized peroxidase-related enzyme